MFCFVVCECDRVCGNGFIMGRCEIVCGERCGDGYIGMGVKVLMVKILIIAMMGMVG